MISNSRKIVLIGGGGHCRSVADTVVRLGVYDEIVVTDKSGEKEELINSIPIVGDDRILPTLYKEGYKYAAITIGHIKSSDNRRKINENTREIGFEFKAIIDPSSAISTDVFIGEGVFVGKGSIINTCSRIGDFSIINTGTIVEHDCRIGSFCHIAVGAVVCGGTEIGDDSFIGANSTIIQGVRIGRKSIIGAGSIVLSDVPDDSTIVGIWKK